MKFFPMFLLFGFISSQVFANDLGIIGTTWKTKFIVDHSFFQTQHSVSFVSAAEVKESVRILINHPLMKGAMRVDIEESYEIGALLPAIPGAYEFNATFKRTWETALDDNMVREFNKQKECGTDKWEVGVAMETTHLDCKNTELKEGGKRFDIIKVDGDTLQFGDIPESDDDHTSSSPDLRPTKLSDKLVYTKQP
jgi:hypothetical protein